MDNQEKDFLESEDISFDAFLEELLKEAETNVPEEEERPALPVRRSRKKEEESPSKTALSYLHDMVYLLAGIIVIFLLCFRVVVVSGSSMYDTLVNGDYLLLLGNLFYSEPQQGDVIVASKQSFDNGKPIVKRVIATEGQWVDIDFEAGIVYVGDDQNNLQPLDEPYTYTPTNLFEGVTFPIQVQEGCIFVMGDNRNDSKDSRNPQIGQIDRREVLGKVIFLFLPGSEGRQGKDFGRIGVVS
jgi:signal peptidase I